MRNRFIQLALIALATVTTLTISRPDSAGAVGKVDESKVAFAVSDVLNAQAAAWNHGDLEKFLSGYKVSPDISYVSADSEVWGYKALRDRYIKRYGDSHETMGSLSFTDLKTTPLGAHNAFCLGHWHLERKDKPTVGGIFSLIFERTDGGWKIIHDHTSARPSKN